MLRGGLRVPQFIPASPIDSIPLVNTVIPHLLDIVSKVATHLISSYILDRSIHYPNEHSHT